MRGRSGKSLILGFLIAGLAVSAAAAAQLPGQNILASPLSYPGAPKRIYNDPKQPYAMNYTDEAAQALGVKDGHMDVFSTQPTDRNNLMPRLSGGVDSSGAMIRLQWRPGN
jgi:hypothetical protein